MENNFLQLPAIVIEDFIPFPEAEMRVDVSNDESIKALKIAEQYNNYMAFIFPKDGIKGNEKFEDFCILGQIILVMKMPGNTRRVKVKFERRAFIEAVETTRPN